MIGCLIFGGLAAMGIARAIHHRRMCAWGGGCHGRWGHGWGGWHHGGHPGYSGGRGWAPFEDDERVDLGGPSFFDGRMGGFAPFAGRMRKRFVVRAILEHVRATPAQERVIAGAFDDFREEMKRAGGGEGRRTRQEIVDALRRPTFDGVVLGEQFARHDTVLESARKSFVGLIAKIHDALEPEQRDRLAELIERGPRSFFGGLRGW
jgi:uncharacterized membrane protein